ncbi:hypothetical protein Agabi119p4_413 [Agaricus bisporus var. burnettii]|uniref:RNA polymerase II subunit A C-terminal domain phosphatase n=1 Tax=Agaricus bisporus var. burnettii TaxID=192524 RepID=A0A8H7FAV9_AGABI|nr:hypothetical protein Agabi119p4_413 [Agaricus bisporus var. burnettii]
MAQSSPTELFLPQFFPFPITIVTLDAQPRDTVQRGTRLLTYSFVHISHSADLTPETRFGTWDAAIEGTLDSWKFNAGDIVSRNKAKRSPALVIVEPCKHGIQVSGLCVICGKDMTNIDYTGFADTSRASIQMTHSANGPTVSLEEAQRIERESAEHLLKSRKLSLIVDLDQTIVHATVDPTVGEWIAEGEAWEARQTPKASTTPQPSDKSDDTNSDSDDNDECNPNWEALKDVKKFRLGPESFSTPYARGPQRSKGKHKMVENEGCMYYIKPRPGWKEFLMDMATKYDMHVYTMGTRAYAEEVCAAIDPDGSVFKSRILSRDESGSLTQKSLQRLFPCDTSMVVIIDDRADVWEWSPNLIKVIPYDFFIGIGDINSSFLAKVNPLTPSPTATASQQPEPSAGALPDTAKPPTPEEMDSAELEKKIMLSTNNAALDEQFEQRPLAKKQEELQGTVVSETSSTSSQASDSKNKLENETPTEESPTTQTEKPMQALLKNDDVELNRIGKLLDEVHRRFFEAYDSRLPDKPRRRGVLSNNKGFNVTTIIPRLRSEVLGGLHLVFSGVIPLDTPPETTEFWRLARMFGAKCHTDLTPDVTHVITAKRGTKKVETARQRGGIKIVRPEWFNDSIALWHRQDETPYLFYDPSNAATSTSPLISEHQISLKLNMKEIGKPVEAAMMESDDESADGRSMGMKSEEESTDEVSVADSANTTPKMRRKRLRSVTPSDTHSRNGDDSLRSPLAKRKKVAADRYSRLHHGITADQLESNNVEEVPETSTTRSTLFGNTMNGDNLEHESDEGEGDDVEDDFLARDLLEDMG